VTPRRLVLRAAALRDIARRESYLREVRGPEFAAAWTEALLRWLERRADLGAQFGTAHPAYPGYRTFGYRRQATILAEFGEGTMDVVRIRFAGEDWLA
jgi:plasmid stabilization system protein ParE